MYLVAFCFCWAQLTNSNCSAKIVNSKFADTSSNVSQFAHRAAINSHNFVVLLMYLAHGCTQHCRELFVTGCASSTNTVKTVKSGSGFVSIATSPEKIHGNKATLISDEIALNDFDGATILVHRKKTIGIGGFGEVYEVEIVGNDQQVALKIFDDTASAQEDADRELTAYKELAKAQGVIGEKTVFPLCVSSGAVRNEFCTNGEPLRYALLPKYDQSVHELLLRPEENARGDWVQLANSILV